MLTNYEQPNIINVVDTEGNTYEIKNVIDLTIESIEEPHLTDLTLRLVESKVLIKNIPSDWTFEQLLDIIIQSKFKEVIYAAIENKGEFEIDIKDIGE